MARGVPIYQIGKLSAADIFLPIFCTSTNGLILFNAQLSCDHFYCVVNHFTSVVAVLLLLAMVYNEFCYITCAIHGKNSLLCISDQLSILATFKQ